VPTTKVNPGLALTDDHRVDELEERPRVIEVRDALAEAASEGRNAASEDPRRAARRAAVNIATAMLSASSAETAAHCDDVDVISEGIGRRLGLSEQKLEDLVVAARLHDIGKVGVPLRILEKPGSLNRDEWEVVRRHTTVGEQILLAVPELRSAARLVRHSHERWDGEGYSDALAGEEIPLGSRIVFCADAFHAIRSDRPYRLGRTAAEALAEIRACAGTQFDPEVVEALEELSRELRYTGRGRPSYAGRTARLMALLLIVGVGASGSALARSGVFPEPTPSSSAPSAAALAANPFASRTSAGAQPERSLVLPGSPEGRAESPLRVSMTGGESGGSELLTFEVPTLGPSPTTLGAPFAVGFSDGIVPSQSDDKPGVRDHGQGIGPGKGLGKGRAREKGKGDQGNGASNDLIKDSASRESGASEVRAKGRPKPNRAGKAKPTPGESAGKSSASSAILASTGKAGSGHSSSSNSNSSQQDGGHASPTTGPPKPVTPPKVASPPPQSPVTPSAADNGNPGGNGSTGESGSAGSKGNSGGNGHT
jgi:hypothetical protein